ncbi:nuclear apoptosis-inducing factor 1-like [Ambystoma mexicanum]|uniref:nuclear apoptosis-inducing factor 1-like n=1 Tax=Ambystoma mexicanum TaxID=8296 RepID=UPI0037E93E04
MPKALKKGAARLRKERFSEEELNMLADSLAENGDFVFSNDMRQPALMQKKEIWAEVAQKVSAVGTTPRTVKDVLKRWDDLRLRVCNIISANRSQGMATGGGAASPIKMTRWEETCTQSESEDQDPREDDATPAKKSRGMEGANCPSTSRERGQPGLLRKPNPTQEPTAQMCIRDTTTAPTPARSTQEPVAEGTVSTASSTVGETADTAAVSDDEQHTPTPGTPTAIGPQQSPQLYPPINQYASSHELSVVESWPGSFSPTGSMHEAPTIPHAPSTSASVRDRQEGIRAIQQRQEELTGLMTQHITECGQAKEEIRECAASLKSAIESTFKDICGELAAVRQDLTQMVAALEALRPTQVVEQPGTSSNASSRQTSPLHRSGQNLRRSDRGPPDAASGKGV